MEVIPEHPVLKFNHDALEAIRKCYDLDEGRVNQALDRLEEWLAKQQHIIKKDFSRSYLERTLIQCKGSVEKAKSQIDRLCTLRTLLPKFFKECNFKEEYEHIIDLAWTAPMPQMTKDYYRMIVIKLNFQELDAAYFMVFYRLNLTLAEYLKKYEYVKGFVVIVDYMNANIFDLISKLNLVELQQYLTILIEGYGTRVQGYHMLSDSKVVDVLAKTLRQVFPPKIAGRINVHSSIESLHKVVDKELLPKEYGGAEKSLKELNKQYIELLGSDEHLAYMKEMNAACTNEALRQKGKFNEEYLGMPGTFKTLTVD